MLPIKNFESKLPLEYDFSISAEDEAERRGQVVQWPKDNEIQLDLDSEEALAEFERRFKDFAFQEIWQTPTVHKRKSFTEGHYHVTIEFADDLNNWMRLALQAALGDDPIRHFLAVRRLVYGCKTPSCLFAPIPSEL